MDILEHLKTLDEGFTKLVNTWSIRGDEASLKCAEELLKVLYPDYITVLTHGNGGYLTCLMKWKFDAVKGWYEPANQTYFDDLDAAIGAGRNAALHMNLKFREPKPPKSRILLVN
ncbi:hypothetical protein [Xanthomonas phage XAJ2]|uniref:Uncharacterized protein n=1 Tax=Xanthomonas phage XAJ2 TaxID=1775249 RepID=A0A1I9L2I0_9CAUD|nr:hypothetical protein [Xanthomonas phage XAJ2]